MRGGEDTALGDATVEDGGGGGEILESDMLGSVGEKGPHQDQMPSWC